MFVEEDALDIITINFVLAYAQKPERIWNA